MNLLYIGGGGGGRWVGWDRFTGPGGGAMERARLGIVLGQEGRKAFCLFGKAFSYIF